MSRSTTGAAYDQYPERVPEGKAKGHELGPLRLLCLRNQSPQSFDLQTQRLKPHLHILKHHFLLLQIVLMLLNLLEMHLYLLFQVFFFLALAPKFLFTERLPFLILGRRRHHHLLIFGEALFMTLWRSLTPPMENWTCSLDWTMAASRCSGWEPLATQLHHRRHS